MRDENDTEDQKNNVANISDDVETAAEDDRSRVEVVETKLEQDGGEGYHFEQPPPGADLASLGTLPDIGPEETPGGPEEIPGFLRRCATETSAQDESFSLRLQNERLAASRASAARAAAEMDMAGDSEDRKGRPYQPTQATRPGGRIPTGARLRGEADPVAGQRDIEFDSPDWSNSARSALSELLTDIDNEQARRVSNRDKFAALAGTRRTTWPLTALIISFLLVVVAYSVRNVDAEGTPGLFLRQAWALVVSPQENAKRDPAPVVSETDPPVAVVPVQAPAPAANTQLAGVQPVMQKKATGLVFEPVKIVGPLGPIKPISAPASDVNPADVNPAKVSNAGSAQTGLRQFQDAQVNAIAPAPAKRKSGTIALAPTKPASLDKMPLASLAVSAAEAAPSNDAPRQFQRLASVSPELIGVGTDSQVDVLSAPATAIRPNADLAAVVPQPPAPEKAPVLQSPPSPATAAVLDNKATKAMLVRAESLLETRDVASARLLFERAASYGSAEGAFGAAKTYDPIWFKKLGVYGVPAEPDKAAALYQIAIDAGHAQATEYLNRLNVLRQRTKQQATAAQR